MAMVRNSTKEAEMSESCKGNKIAIVVAHEFEDVELLYPIIRLSEEGAEISVVPIQEELHTRLTDDNYYSSPRCLTQ